MSDSMNGRKTKTTVKYQVRCAHETPKTATFDTEEEARKWASVGTWNSCLPLTLHRITTVTTSWERSRVSYRNAEITTEHLGEMAEVR